QPQNPCTESSEGPPTSAGPGSVTWPLTSRKTGLQSSRDPISEPPTRHHRDRENRHEKKEDHTAAAGRHPAGRRRPAARPARTDEPEPPGPRRPVQPAPGLPARLGRRAVPALG